MPDRSGRSRRDGGDRARDPRRLEGVEATAWLVNESRARRPELSHDRFARTWIPDAQRAEVVDLWEEFARAVYPHDDLVVSLRGRAVLDALTAAHRRDPSTVLLSVGAGFTSYPWLLPFEQTIELDLPSVIEAKAARSDELMEAGLLPRRAVHHVALDVGAPDGPARIARLVDEHVAPERSVTLLLEGLIYYLPAARAFELLQLPQLLDRPIAATVASYWPAGQEDHVVLERQAVWFAHRGIPPEVSHLAPEEVSTAIGGASFDEGPVELQRRYGCTPLVPEHDLIPERVVWSTG